MSDSRRATQSPVHALRRLLPFMAWLPQVGRSSLRGDLMAGLTGAVIVLPQCVAYALIAGLPPQYGVYTAIVTPIIAGLFGSSYHLVSGPTAAISIVVFSVVSDLASPGSPEFIAYALTLTFMVGAIQLLLGIIRMGSLVNFISHTVVVGFTTGAALLIAASQLKHLFGLNLPSEGNFFETIHGVLLAVNDINPYALAIGAITVGTAVAVKMLRPRWPGMVIAMITGSVVGVALDAGERGVALVGEMPRTLPPPSLPLTSWETMGELVPGALAVAVIALVEAVSIAKAVAMRSNQRIDGNQEFVGQGLSNLIGSFFSCYAGSGSFTRTGANYDAGARTPLSAIFAAVILAAIVLIAPGATAYLPMPAMAGIVLLIAWNLLDFKQMRHIFRVSGEETLVFGVTIAATLVVALEFAVYAGVLLSLILYLRHSAHPKLVGVVPVPDRPNNPLRNAVKHNLPECRQVKVLRIDGSLFFGSTAAVQSELQRLTDAGYRYVLLVGSGLDSIDLTAAEMLVSEARRLAAQGGGLYFSNLKDSAAKMLRHPDFKNVIGDDHLYASPNDALTEIFRHQPTLPCEQCPLRRVL